MKLYTTQKQGDFAHKIAADDLLLTTDMATTAGSKMLQGYMSLFEAEVLTRLQAAGYTVSGKAQVGEFGIDLLGETAYDGALTADGVLKNASAELVKTGEVEAAVVMDVNGAPRRAAAQSGLCAVKPTYGTVSRYGTVPVACSGETVSVMAKTAQEAMQVLGAMAGHDEKDGTSVPDDMVKNAKASLTKTGKVAVLLPMCAGADAQVTEALAKCRKALENSGVTVCEESSEVIALSRAAWNVLMSAELCNNVSRYDGVKYGYRSEHYTNIDELYINSRTEAFGELLKQTILFGSETLSTENYMKVYDKALRMRRVISEAFGKLFEQYDAVLMPACSRMAYSEDTEAQWVFEENFYTAPASLTGLPVIVAGGVQLVGKAFGEEVLAELASVCEKEVG